MNTNASTGFKTDLNHPHAGGGGGDFGAILSKISGPLSVAALLIALIALICSLAAGGGDTSRLEKIEAEQLRMTEEITRQNTRMDGFQSEISRLTAAAAAKPAKPAPQKAKSAPAKKSKAPAPKGKKK